MPPKATTKRASPVKKKTAAKPKANRAARVEAQFPIVAIGASAGGLEALEEFLSATPENCDIAFVVIQHLDPHHKGMLPELLQNTTSMPDVQVKDRMSLQPNRVYVIPPNKDLSILHGILHLLKPTKTKGLHLPIDYFFRSLAQDQHAKSIGVILSAMGSDGSLGLQAIKQQSGLVLVQEPSNAKSDGMIHTNLVDIIAPVNELPIQILDSLKRKSPPNEELQSTNEELSTSKEEMQWLNEERQTLNSELQAKLDELNLTSTDMKNLLDSTDIAILFLDKKLKIRRFTPQTTKIIKFIPSDIGRPISDLSSALNDSELLKNVHSVLNTLVPQEKELSTSKHRWYNLRIVPDRTMNE